MLKITNDFEIMEMMIFFWESVAEKEKVSNSYFLNIAEKPEMSVLYDKDFSKESVVRILSSIVNRERLNDRTKIESKFWNNNMRMLEDKEMTDLIINPVKILNFESLEKKHHNINKEIRLVFIPGCSETYYTKDNDIYINFFKLINDFMNPEQINMDGKPFKERLEEIIELFI